MDVEGEPAWQSSRAGADPLGARLQPFVAGGAYPGLAALLWTSGEPPAFTALGPRDRRSGDPIGRDTIFRLASMTKPITSAAAMILVDEGRLDLAAPITRWLPEAAAMSVLRTPASPLDDVAPARRPPTLFELMTHTAGFAWGKGLDLPICRAMDAATGTSPFIPHEPDVLVRRVCALPLICQPGSRWHYSNGSDLLGVVVARAAGTGLAEFLQERIFAPLGMADTGFFVPAAKLHRLAVGYARDGAGFAVHDDPRTGYWSRPPAFAAGGGGLVSTVDDYLAFARLLLSGGVAGSRRILSRASLRLMTTNRLAAEQLRPLDRRADYLHGQGFGLGLAVTMEQRPHRRSEGSFGWPGGYGTTWFADPRRQRVGILMTQVWQDHLTELTPAFEAAACGAPR
jgi:CubicO group peptidase (beta-lactamase class C family)